MFFQALNIDVFYEWTELESLIFAAILIYKIEFSNKILLTSIKDLLDYSTTVTLSFQLQIHILVFFSKL